MELEEVEELRVEVGDDPPSGVGLACLDGDPASAYDASLERALKAGVLTVAQADRARAWAKEAKGKELADAVSALDRKIAAESR